MAKASDSRAGGLGFESPLERSVSFTNMLIKYLSKGEHSFKNILN